MKSSIVKRAVLSSQEKLLSYLGAQFLSMEDIQTLAKDLASKIAQSYHPDLIIGIDRGGTYPAYCLSKEMGIPYTTIDISREKSYLGGIEVGDLLVFPRLLKKTQEEPRIRKPFRYNGNMQKTLIVDDDCRSMKTLNLAKEHLKEKGLESRTSVILTVPHGTPDFFANQQLPLSRFIQGKERFPWLQYSSYFQDYQKWVADNSEDLVYNPNNLTKNPGLSSIFSPEIFRAIS